MGGGASKVTSRQVIDTFYSSSVNYFQEIMTEAISQSNAKLDTYQKMNWSNLHCLGDLNISNISQDAMVQLDMEQVAEHIDSIDIEAKVSEFIDIITKQDSNIATELGAPQGDNEQIDKTYMETRKRFTNNVNKSTFNEVMAKVTNFQEINVDSAMVLGDCNFNNLSQNFWSELVIRSISTSLTDVFSQIVQENKLKKETDQGFSFEGSGLGSILGYVVIIAIIIAIIIALGVGAFLLVKFSAFL